MKDYSVQACNALQAASKRRGQDEDRAGSNCHAPSGGATPEPRNLEPGKPQALRLGAFRAEVIAAYRGDSPERRATFPGGRQKRVRPRGEPGKLQDSCPIAGLAPGLPSFSECSEMAVVTDWERISRQSLGSYAKVSPFNDRGIPRLRSARARQSAGADDGGNGLLR